MKLLLLDIETSPNTAYVWGLFRETIPLARLIESSEIMCWSAKWFGEKTVYFRSIHRNTQDELLDGLYALLDEADAVIHYNGNKFDIPVVNKEFLFTDRTPPSPYKNVDLYRVVRKQFNFTSYKLDYVVQKLGLGRKINTTFELWIDCMKLDDKAWKKMERYNKNDIIILEKLYKKLLPWINNHPNYGVYVDSNKPVCPTCGSTKLQKRGQARTKTGIYTRYHCTKCGSWHRSRFTEVDKDKRSNILVGV